ncbi:uncharacterized protein NECHADRAFT_102310 [Fusarium vanettenii 77-13-4]|uniref:Uncharacterized protein n=1 Tax=Fusarium vanettenii (strain ATCC MYA-4622 / CBS 123669 / FGSC 9596 / NRRL 45880 / 77-13-4) TaxID=660122 RepID=C7ZR45_FUSV7|nr:uncharacterized protein NECHADRAFT_102310 [Fusarium vanettenii 77-13-4]EEU33511.1 predicted protein [Fusarium vanettenii 77-13-4]
MAVTLDKLVLAIHCQATGNSGGGKGLAGARFVLVCRLRVWDWLVWVPLSRPVGSVSCCESYLGRWESHQRLLLRMSFVLVLAPFGYNTLWLPLFGSDLLTVPNVTTLLLHIPPETIAELTVGCPNELHQIVREQLGPRTTCLSFRLHQPPQLVVPKGPLAPRRQREHGDKLDSLKLLSQATSLDIYFDHGILQDATARTVCDLAASPRARSVAQYANLDSLYAGKGGVVLAAESPPSPPTAFPPAYNELCGTTPPPPPHQDHPSPARSSRKRRRKSPDPFDVESICPRAVKDMFSLYKKDLQEMLGEIKNDILDHVDRRLNEIHRLSDTYNREEIDELVQEVRNDGEDYTDSKINDRVLDIKAELKEYAEDQLRDTEERVLKRLKSASWALKTGDE